MAPGQNDGHAVVNRRGEFISLSGDDCRGVPRLWSVVSQFRRCLRRRPAFPQTCECKGLMVTTVNEKRLIVAAAGSPLIIAISKNEAATFLKCLAKRLLFMDCFAAGIDHAARTRRVFGPTGNQSPVHPMELSLTVGCRQCGNTMCWCDIVFLGERNIW